MELYSALEKSFVPVLRRVVVGGFDVGSFGFTCVWRGVDLFQDFDTYQERCGNDWREST